MINYNFGCFCLLTLDLNEICGMNNQNQKQKVDLINLFQVMNTRQKVYNLEDQIYCDRCLSYQIHIKNKQLYSMPYELIISLERGSNYINKTLINFPFFLDLSNLVELREAPKKYQLVGCVNAVEIKGEQHYISFTKDNNSENWFCYDDDKINQTERNLAITYGTPILLFYSYIRENN